MGEIGKTKEYNKNKLYEYSKKLLELCIEKDLVFLYEPEIKLIRVHYYDGVKINYIGSTYIKEGYFNKYEYGSMPIWELIKKVQNNSNHERHNCKESSAR